MPGPAPPPPPSVDYGRVAATYAAGRALPPEVLAAWGAVVRLHLADLAPGPVLDVGAGSGVFLAALAAWSGRPVVGIEPSPAMRAAAADAGAVGPRSAGGGPRWLVGAVGEGIPVRRGAACAAWLSAVVHHLADPAAVGGELRAVLAPGAPVLVRGYVPGRSRVPWAERFPGHGRAVARFPAVEAVTGALAPHGFRLVDVAEVVERRATHAEAAAWARRMRSADSLLAPLTDDEVAAGLRALAAEPGAVSETVLHLIVLRARE